MLKIFFFGILLFISLYLLLFWVNTQYKTKENLRVNRGWRRRRKKNRWGSGSNNICKKKCSTTKTVCKIVKGTNCDSDYDKCIKKCKK